MQNYLFYIRKESYTQWGISLYRKLIHPKGEYFITYGCISLGKYFIFLKYPIRIYINQVEDKKEIKDGSDGR